MKIEIKPTRIVEDRHSRFIDYLNSPIGVTIFHNKLELTHTGVNIKEDSFGYGYFVPAPGFGEVETATQDQLRDLQAMVRDLAGGYRRLLDENAQLSAQLENALKSVPEMGKPR